MLITTYCESLEQLEVIKNSNVTEILLGSIELSRYGKLKLNNQSAIAKAAKNLGIKTILDFDILINQQDFEHVIQKFSELDLADFDSIRIQDPGVLNYLLENTDKPIQFITESRNHNLLALQSWLNFANGRIERLVLSIELPKEKIKEYSEKLNVEVELLGLGRILLFYTPRNLLAPLAIGKTLEGRTQAEQSKEFIEATGASQESPHKGFPIIENRHGTFMFHIKDFCLLEHLEELADYGLSYFRVDLRFGKPIDLLQKIEELKQNFSLAESRVLKSEYPTDTMKGFYSVNKSDVLFKKLKNSRIQRKDESYIGEVIEAKKDKYTAILLKGSQAKIQIGDSLKVINPEGREVEVIVNDLSDTDRNKVESVTSGNLALIKFHGRAWVRSQVYNS